MQELGWGLDILLLGMGSIFIMLILLMLVLLLVTYLDRPKKQEAIGQEESEELKTEA